MNILKNMFFLTLLMASIGADAQKTVTLKETINWKTGSISSAGAGRPFITFDNASRPFVASALPYYSYLFEHGFDADISTRFETIETTPLTPAELATITNTADIPEYFTDPVLTQSLKTQVFKVTIDRKPAARVIFLPLYKDFNGTIKKITSFTLTITATPTMAATTASTYLWADNSVLKSGKWAKITISKNGVYALGVQKLADAGLDISGADVSAIRLYGNGSGMIPQHNLAPKTDDLVENAISVKDNNGNGKFDGNDVILFYAEGAHAWEFDYAQFKYKSHAHRYADKNYYYVTVGTPGGKRIAAQAEDGGNANFTTKEFDDLYLYEKDLSVFLKSGREWVGEEFDKVLSYDFRVDVPDIVPGETVKIRSQAVGRSMVDCKFDVTCNGQFALTQTIPGITFGTDYDFIAVPDTAEGSCTVNSSPLTVRYTFTKTNGSSKGWLNYFELVARRKMHLNGQVIFRDSRNMGAGNLTEFVFDNAGQTISIWEITNPQNATLQQTRKNGQEDRFNLNTPTLRQFVAFSDNALLTPEGVEGVKNQNLHGLRDINMVIIVHPNFTKEAERLADFHRTHDNLTVTVATPQEIYNEFSAGKQDVGAIRNFMKMFYDRGATPGKSLKYLLLFGDASYDYKDRLKNNTNYVPTYQSRNNYNPVYSYCTDEFFAMLDDNEGVLDENVLLNETMDIGVGRLPVQTVEQAKQMVDKIIRYTDKKTFGDWRNLVCFVADDEDTNIHLGDGEAFSGVIENQKPVYNIEKIYLDAYKQVSVGSGARYPDVNNVLNHRVERGALIVNYNGHGGEQGLAHEQILDVPMINAWDNAYSMPLFVTATCEFSRFDDPGRTSAGELVLLNPNGGGIALFSTVREVFQGPNHALNEAVYNHNAFDLHNGEVPRLGDIFRRAKNAAIDFNNRNFSMLGDPAVTLAYPYHTVVTTSVNGNPAGTADSAGALSKVTIRGQVQDAGGSKLSNFNGVVYPIVFDKESTVATLVNDPDSRKANFQTYKNIIYKGKASVKNGEFEFSFIVPKDISYTHGHSRISYYATDNTTDAHGYYDSLIATGTDATAPKDVTGPTVRVFMNDTTFKFGGETDESPVLLAQVSDIHGINTTGNGIGRDLTAILDGDRTHMIILNDYYQAKLDSYEAGEIRYPLFNLEEGHHSIKVKVWDVYNNSAEGYTEFVVEKSDKLAIKRLMNYPNPFSDKTVFYFEHNKAGKEINVTVDIYTISGQLVRTLTANVPSAGANFDGLTWDAANDYGGNISQGIYLFRIKVRCGNDTVEDSQKMVLIK